MAPRNQIHTEGRSIWWCLFCSPGAALLWLEYMAPSSLKGSIGTARRKDSVPFQFLATLLVYAALYLALTHLTDVGRLYDIFLRPLVSIVSYPFQH